MARGWRSRQMLQRYGASAADQRARDAHRRLSPRNELAAAFDQRPDYRERCRAAAQWVEELLVIPASRPGTPMAGQVDMLGEELQGILDVLTAEGGDRR